MKFNKYIFICLTLMSIVGVSNASERTIEDRLKNVVVNQFGVKLEEIKRESSLTYDLGADPLDKVELIMAVEEEFDIFISDRDAETMITIKAMIDYIELNN